jgi:hypothetical protein
VDQQLETVGEHLLKHPGTLIFGSASGTRAWMSKRVVPSQSGAESGQWLILNALVMRLERLMLTQLYRLGSLLPGPPLQ